ncbi:MAG: DUF1579 family protein [Pseudomonadota bacterium]
MLPLRSLPSWAKNFKAIRAISSAIKQIGVFSVACCALGCATLSDSDGVSARSLSPSDWAALSRPGESHKLLDLFVGEWDVKLTFWSSPYSVSSESSGRSTIASILGGRFLEERFEGHLGGERYEGRGIMGYDNASRRFQSVWLDSLNTAVALSSGRFDPDQRIFKMVSKMYDPLIGGEKEVRSEIRLNSNDSYTFSMIDRSPEQRDFTSLKMEYTRRSLVHPKKSS